MSDRAITPADFQRIRTLAHRLAGLNLSAGKVSLVESRLGRRLDALGLRSYGDYVERITTGNDRGELQTALDLLTTNETYFFREPRHFEHLRDEIVPKRRLGAKFRVWSAACSSGEEPYSIAMLLADKLGLSDWEVVASDLSTRVLERARVGQYSLARTEGIPEQYLRRFCLRGIGENAGVLMVDARIRARVRFVQHNLLDAPPASSPFDVILLRNVMIYFDQDTKRSVIAKLLPALAPGGHFYIGHSETLQGIGAKLTPVRPAIFRKPQQ